MHNIKNYLFGVSVILLSSCTQTPLMNFDATVKQRAAFDFNCPESYVIVIAEGLTKYAAKGCGQQANYEIKCSLGPCMAQKI